ncbi:MAG: type III pantothenate kinase [Candidatus Sedimenticola sp. 20ELBAFRAG]
MSVEPIKNDSLLLVDIGNTNMKWAWLVDGQISPVQSVPHSTGRFARIAASCWGSAEQPVRVVLANVAGDELERQLADWTQHVWGLSPEVIVSSRKTLGVTNAYTDPSQLGVDRWLTLIAVHGLHPGPACIVDCGTAITVDVMDDGGSHLGGVILPGLDLMRHALLDKTRIPRVEKVDVDNMLATDTASAVASASIHSAAALVERVVGKSSQTLGVSPSLVLTGSDANILLDALDISGMVIPELVMTGLALVATDGEYAA